MKHIDPYMSAEALNVKEEYREALIQLTKMLLNEELDDFDMKDWQYCICGQMCNLSPEPLVANNLIGNKLRNLFLPPMTIPYSEITQKMAGQACLNYLTTGNEDWSSVLAEA